MNKFKHTTVIAALGVLALSACERPYTIAEMPSNLVSHEKRLETLDEERVGEIVLSDKEIRGSWDRYENGFGQYVFFAENSDATPKNGMPTIDWMVNRSADYHHYEFVVIGYADAEESNPLEVAGNRADALVDYLISKGIPNINIYTEVKPDTYLVQSSDPKNRRAEVILSTPLTLCPEQWYVDGIKKIAPGKTVNDSNCHKPYAKHSSPEKYDDVSSYE